MVLQTQLGLNKQQIYSHEQNYYSDSSHGQVMRPSSYSTHNNHMMMGHAGKHHGGYYGSHGHGYGSHGHHGHMPHDLTNFSSSSTMVHNDGGYGTGMQQSSLAHMSSSSMAMGHHGHGHGYGGSHPSSYSQSHKFNWALKNLDD